MKETEFLLWVSGVICGWRKRNPVSGVLGVAGGAKKPGFCDNFSFDTKDTDRNPVSGVLGVAVGRKKPGFCCGYQELSVGGEKETRFLGFWGGCWGKETGFLLWVSGVICEMRERNPVSGVSELIDFNIHPTIAILKHNYEANE